jgi:dephospho-CoA kinase
VAVDGGSGSAPNATGHFLVLGLTGPIGGGKTYVRDRLIEVLSRAGVTVVTYSFSAIVRSELERRGLDPTRDTMNEVGNDLRRRYGPGILAERILDSLGPHLCVLVNPTVFIAEALRNPGEVEVFRRRLGDRFRLIAITAGDDILAQRLTARQRDLDVRSGESTLVSAARWIDIERGTGQPSYGQQTFSCVQMADRLIDNSGSLAELDALVDTLATDVLASLTRSGPE